MTVVHTYFYITFVILRHFIEIHTKQHFDGLYRSMLQYYMTDCTAQCCNIIYYLYMKEEQLWQNERNSALCELQLAAERLNSVHRLSRGTNLISPRDIYGRIFGEFHKRTGLVTFEWPAVRVHTRYSKAFFNFSVFILIPYNGVVSSTDTMKSYFFYYVLGTLLFLQT